MKVEVKLELDQEALDGLAKMKDLELFYWIKTELANAHESILKSVRKAIGRPEESEAIAKRTLSRL